MKKSTQAQTNPFEYSDSNKRYHTYDFYLRHTFGGKCVKISLDAGLECPNLDGTRGTGGCIYCLSGSSSNDMNLSLTEQFKRGVEQLRTKWGADVKYIPYLQAHTNTYASAERLKEIYGEVMSLGSIYNIVGLNIATRADALEDDAVAYLRELSEMTCLTVELGLQSIHDSTARRINRGHTFSEFLIGYEKLRGIDVCVHIINGLPDETHGMMLDTARVLAKMKPAGIKIHMLHVLRGTALCVMYERGEIELLTLKQYVDTVCDQLELLPPEIYLGRVTGDGMADSLVAPLWTLKKVTVMNEIDKEMSKRGIVQGDLCK